MKKGRKILEYLNSLGVPVYFVPGNNDWTAPKNHDKKEWDYMNQDFYSQLVKDLENMVDVHHKITDIDGYQIIGHGITSSPEYPEDLANKTKEELQKIKENYEEQKAKLVSLFEKTTKPVIFISHNIPFNTPLDEITNKESPKYRFHFGSIIAREMCEQFQPVICIGGHMHEHFGECKIGKTIVINSGFGGDKNIWLELDNGKIKKLEFYQE